MAPSVLSAPLRMDLVPKGITARDGFFRDIGMFRAVRECIQVDRGFGGVF